MTEWKKSNWQIVVSLSFELYLYLCFLCCIYLFTIEDLFSRNRMGKKCSSCTTTRICGATGTTGCLPLHEYVMYLRLHVIDNNYSNMWYVWDHSDVQLRNMWFPWDYRWCIATRICGVTVATYNVQLQRYAVWLWLQVIYVQLNECGFTATIGNIQLHGYVLWLRLKDIYSYMDMWCDCD